MHRRFPEFLSESARAVVPLGHNLKIARECISTELNTYGRRCSDIFFMNFWILDTGFHCFRFLNPGENFGRNKINHFIPRGMKTKLENFLSPGLNIFLVPALRARKNERIGSMYWYGRMKEKGETLLCTT